MKKTLIKSVFIIWITVFSLGFTYTSDAPSVEEWIAIRNSYRRALSNSNDNLSFEKICEPFYQLDAVAKAYYGTALALRARAVIFPITKLNLANQAATQLNSAVNLQPKNLEIRFLRYSFEYNTPALLNLKTHMLTDKYFAITFIKTQSPIRDLALQFASQCNNITDAEKKSIGIIKKN